MLAYITYKNQEWTIHDKKDLLPLLQGDDDYILDFEVESEDFAIITKNGHTYDVRASQEDAQAYIDSIYKNYSYTQNQTEHCVFSRDNPSRSYPSVGAAQLDGEYDYILVPQNHYYLCKFGKIIATAPTLEEIEKKLYAVSGGEYSFVV